ncbi:hypothetical protein AKO1_007368 [Acrasis kona]|uniref:AB hydrolase-1 domain-containing protein n=1 Tax=Acrasis kona TaxID=1008807 RepID=A0AAW2YQZ2_9EUKA
MILAVLCVVVTALVLYALVHYMFMYDDIKVICIDSTHNKALIKQTPILSIEKKYRYPMFVGWHPLLHVGYSSVLRSGKPQKHHREIITDKYTKFEEPITLDWIGGSIEQGKPLHHPTLIVIPGIAGSTHANYIQNFVEVSKKRFRVVVYNRPGCGDLKLTSARFFLNAHPLTIKCIVDHVDATLEHKSPLFAIGYSMGGQNVLRYLAEHTDTPLRGVVTVCQPFDSTKTCAKLIENPIYDRVLTKNLQEIVIKNKHLYEPLEVLKQNDNLNKVLSAKTLTEFDNYFTLPVHGFKDLVTDYYEGRNVTEDHLKAVKTPIIMIQADDDKVVVPEELAQYVFEHASRHNENLVVVRTKHGSHCAYEEMGPYLFAPNKVAWMDRLADQLLMTLSSLHQ